MGFRIWFTPTLILPLWERSPWCILYRWRVFICLEAINHQLQKCKDLNYDRWNVKMWCGKLPPTLPPPCVNQELGFLKMVEENVLITHSPQRPRSSTLTTKLQCPAPMAPWTPSTRDHRHSQFITSCPPSPLQMTEAGWQACPYFMNWNV